MATFEHTRTSTSNTCRNDTSITTPAGRYPLPHLRCVYTTRQYRYTPVSSDMIQLTAAFAAVYTATSAKRETTALYTPWTIGSRSIVNR